MHNLFNDVRSLEQEIKAYLVHVHSAKTLASSDNIILENGAQHLQRLLEEVTDYDPDLSKPLESLQQRFTNLKRRLDPLLPSGEVVRVQVTANPPSPIPDPEAKIYKTEQGWWLERTGERTLYRDLGTLANAVGMVSTLTDDLDLWRASLFGNTFTISKARPFSGFRVSLTLPDDR
ncbi:MULTISPECIES: hypothetical protein [Meiothermus]|uniref:Uncharacterized protein n=1 Tax=Meiothermus ruber (strain ATCC 35948 / DSM 1279 / VKM B-1258 / 21) TaxID=504728 RepID=D3PNH2_MEIRD|nr:MULTISPECIES: hypothetical protein [Meiothermus]ADD27363.1 hypothetical protein Mrub_0593 [Meiothermus ruber DSM 1279]AGK03824.1 hypothetical protein K649_02610 [Meiothermus ruber DSM 1279]GIW28890.1 MAG: hypothetical protein KatS3mg070_2253 [Meiothermus sp.]